MMVHYVGWQTLTWRVVITQTSTKSDQLTFNKQ